MVARLMPVIAAVLGAVTMCAYAAEPQRTTITADKLVFDYKRSVATFEGHVRVLDPEVTIDADTLTVVMDGTNEIKAVTALGEVRIQNEDKVATCHKAVYQAKTGEIIMTGDAELSRGKEVVRGNKITFWLNEDRMTCEPGHLILTPRDRQSGAGKEPTDLLRMRQNSKQRAPESGAGEAGAE